MVLSLPVLGVTAQVVFVVWLNIKVVVVLGVLGQLGSCGGFGSRSGDMSLIFREGAAEKLAACMSQVLWADRLDLFQDRVWELGIGEGARRKKKKN